MSFAMREGWDDERKLRVAKENGALPCPFCGAEAEAEPWHGGGLRKHHVSCSNEMCAVGPGCCGATLLLAIAAWNGRAGSERTKTDG